MLIPFHKKLKGMPKEVIWHIETTMFIHTFCGGMTGAETIEKLRAVEDKYPDYFPWEATYRSIPKEVHEAYWNEKYPDWNKPLFSEQWEGNEGLLAHIQKAGKVFEYNPAETKSILEMFKDIYEADRKKKEQEAEQEKKDKTLWDKYYKKYKLEYRP